MQDSDCAKLILETVPKSMRVIRKEMRGCAAPQLTVPQFRILVRLAESPTSNVEMADSVGVSPPTMTRMIDALAKKEMVQRREGKDRRLIELSITHLGQTRLDEIRGVVRGRFEKRINNLEKEQKDKLFQGLQILKELFSE